MHDTGANLTRVHQRIADAATAAGRDAQAITLVAVSKTQPAQKIRDAVAAGQRDFGENYLQEALEKMDALSGSALVWHFIGPIQSNKTRDIACHFDWVHSLDRWKIARRLAEQRPEHAPPLNVCLQVNISGESSKSGIEPANTAELAEQLGALPRLRLRGLMAVPAPAHNVADQRGPFAQLRALFNQLNAQGHNLDTLSMGMTDDLEAAIAEGSTLLRVGTAVFGTRR